jgi:gas vesicle protein
VIILAAFFSLLQVISSQSCIRNELLAAIEELEHRNNPVVSCSAQIEELNSTIQQGLQEIRGELQESIQNIKEELQGVQKDINDNLKEVKQGMEGKLQGIQQLLSTILSLHYNPGYSPSHPAHSCKEIYDRNTSSPSGYYWLESSSEPVQAYCDMERTCGGMEGGWMKVISINMSNSSSSCPSGLKTLTSPKRLCAMNINVGGCSSAHLDGHAWSRILPSVWENHWISTEESKCIQAILQQPRTDH